MQVFYRFLILAMGACLRASGVTSLARGQYVFFVGAVDHQPSGAGQATDG
jgi:hypothetical protein